MKEYRKPEIKVKEVVMQPLMGASDADETINMLQDIINPEVSQSKMENMFWDLLEE